MNTFFKDMKFVFSSLQLLNIKRTKIFVLVIITILNSIVILAQPLLLGNIINAVNLKRLPVLYVNIATLIACFLLSMICLYIKNKKTIKLVSEIEIEIKNTIFNNILYTSYCSFSKNDSGKLINIINQDSMIFSNIFNYMLEISIDALSFIITIAMLFYINFKLAIIVLITFPLSLVVYYISGKKLKKEEYKLKLGYDNYMSFLTESLKNFKLVKIYNYEQNRINDFKKLMLKVYQVGIRKVTIETFAEIIIQILLFLSKISVILLGIYFIFKGRFSLGMLVSFNAYSDSFKQSASNISKMNSTFQAIIVSLERIKTFSFIKNEKVEENTSKIGLAKITNIRLNDVSYSYDNQNVLNNINCHFKAGDINWVCGDSGSGKTTLFNILSKVLENYNGEIYFDGYNLRDYSNLVFRKKVCYVTQENLLFSLSIKENLIMGDNSINMEKMIDVCKQLNIHEFIISLENGYDTILYNSGSKISGGQSQRLCIARAILKNAEVYIFDEVVSSLDKNNADIVMQCIKNMSVNKLIVIASHQKSKILSTPALFL